jgi:hypothetical protein
MFRRATSITWGADGHIYGVSAEVDRAPSLWRYRDDQVSELPAVPDDCRIDGQSAVLGYTQIRPVPNRASLILGSVCGNDMDSTTVYSYDIQSRTHKQLGTVQGRVTSAIARNDALDPIVEIRISACGNIAPLLASGPARFPSSVEFGAPPSRYLAGDLTDCGADGAVGFPAYCGDATEVLVLITADSSDGGADPRSESNWALVSIDTKRMTLTVYADGFASPGGIDVAPDGRHVAVAAERNGDVGVWEIDLQDRSTKRIHGGSALSPTYSPDSRQLAIIVNETQKDVAIVKVR